MPRSLTLDPDLFDFVDSEVASGRFRRPEDVVAAGLTLLRSQESDQRKLDALNARIREGLASPVVGTASEVFAEVRARLHRNA